MSSPLNAVVMGVEVDRATVLQWRDWMMPELQPYVVPADLATERGWSDQRDQVSFEVTDSFWLYGDADKYICLLSRSQARTLPAEVRAAQPAAHRWPSADLEADLARLLPAVTNHRRSSRHREVSDATWQAAAGVLPRARELAGRFAAHSGPNCFGTVMAVAGEVGAEHEWMQPDVMDEWLEQRTIPGGDDGPGTVLIWRTADGTLVHTSVCLGDDWALHKQSQGWMSPVVVLSVREMILQVRYAGWHLTRRTLLPAASGSVQG